MLLLWIPAFPEWMMLVAILLFLSFKYATRHENYWKNQNVPYEKLSLFFGTTLQFIFRPFHIVEYELYKKHGRVFGTFEDGNPTIYVGEPELIKQVLIKDFSELGDRNILAFGDHILENTMSFVKYDKWKKLRSASAPAFSTAKLRKLHSCIERSILTTCEYLKDAANHGRQEEVKRLFNHYTLASISSFALGTALEQYTPETEALVSCARDAVFGNVTFARALQVLSQNFINTLHLNFFKREAFHVFEKLTLSILHKRKGSTKNHDDFLHMMMKAKENATETEQDVTSADKETEPMKPQHKKGLTELEAIAQCVLFLISGQDPASSASALTAYLLALHPDVQQKLRDEIDACFEEHGPSPGYDVISKLTYLDAVVKESMRLLSPNTRLERTPTKSDYILGDTGIKVPKGGLIVIPAYAVHHDPEYFPDPFTFKPERFSEHNGASIRPYTYLPFGAGPRNCIGGRLGIIMVKTGIFYTVRSVKFVRSSKTKVPLEFRPGYGLLAPKDITVGIQNRDT